MSAATTFSDLRNEGTLALGFHGKRSRHHVRGDGRHRARLPVAPVRRRRVDRSARPQHDGRPRLHATASTRSATRTTAMADAARAPRARRRRSVHEVGADLRQGQPPGMTRWEDIAIDTAQVDAHPEPVADDEPPARALRPDPRGLPVQPVSPGPDRAERAAGAHPRHPRALVAVGAPQPLPAQAQVRGPLRRAGSTTTPGAWSAATSSSATRSTSARACSLRFFARASISRPRRRSSRTRSIYETESTAGEYFTGDRELSPVRNATVGAKLTADHDRRATSRCGACSTSSSSTCGAT